MSLWEYANPVKFLKLSDKVLPFLVVCSVIGLTVGLFWGFFLTPDERNQGSTVKIIYLHVPSAFIAINAWIMMLVASIIWLVRRHHVSALAAKAAAPIGVTMTVVAIVTGALWGQPIWNSWWEWDARLTAFFVLFLFYLGYIALWSAIDNPDTAADLTSMLCIVGSVFALLSRYAVYFSDHNLHQPASLSLDKEKNIADVFYQPLLFSIFGFVFLFLTLVLIGTRTEIRLRRTEALRLRKDRE